MKMGKCVPKHRHIKFRRWGITQKKSIQHSEHGKNLKSRKQYFCLKPNRIWLPVFLHIATSDMAAFVHLKINNSQNFIVEPCIDTISINNNQLMHISVFIKNTLKVYLKFLLPRHVSDHTGIHPQGAIIRS